MREKKAVRGSCNYPRTKLSTPADSQMISNAWTRAQCHAIEISLGGGFLLLAILAVMFRW